MVCIIVYKTASCVTSQWSLLGHQEDPSWVPGCLKITAAAKSQISPHILPKPFRTTGRVNSTTMAPRPTPTISMTRTPFTFQSWLFQDSFSKHLIGPFLFILVFLESLFRGELRCCVISLLFYCFVFRPWSCVVWDKWKRMKILKYSFSR